MMSSICVTCDVMNMMYVTGDSETYPGARGSISKDNAGANADKCVLCLSAWEEEFGGDATRVRM